MLHYLNFQDGSKSILKIYYALFPVVLPLMIMNMNMTLLQFSKANFNFSAFYNRWICTTVEYSMSLETITEVLEARNKQFNYSDLDTNFYLMQL